MAKNKPNKKQKNKKPQKSNGNGTHMRAQEAEQDVFAEAEEGDEEVGEETPDTETRPIDHALVQELFPQAFAAEQAIEAAQEKVKARRAELTEIVLKLREACGGRSGPFLVNGKRIQIRQRGDNAFLVKEVQGEIPAFDVATE